MLCKINYLDEYTTFADTAQIKKQEKKKKCPPFLFLLPLYFLPLKERNSHTKSQGRHTKQQFYPGMLLRKGKSHIFGHSKTMKAKLQTQIFHLGK